MTILIFFFSVLTSLLGGSPALSFDERFPTEIQLNVIGFCDPRTVIRMSRTCHRYNELCSNNNLWRRLYNRKFRRKSESKCFETTAKYHIGRNNTIKFSQDNGRLKSNNFFFQRSITVQKNVKKSDFRPHYSVWQFIYHEKDQKRQREKERVKDLITKSLTLDENYPEVLNKSVNSILAQNSSHKENNDVIDLSSLFNSDDIPFRFDIFSDEEAFNQPQHPNSESEDEKEPVTTLNLFCKHINYLPSHDWEKFSYLRQINLSYNYIRSLPKGIGRLINLTSLDISDNRITHLPEEFFNLAKIENLFLAKNRLKEISESIKNFNKLDILDLSYNDIKILPSVLVYLPITDLVLDHNPLEKIPLLLKMYGPDKSDATLKILCVPHKCLNQSLSNILKNAQTRFRLYICLGQKKFLKNNNLLNTKNYIAAHVEGYCSCDNDESE